MSISILIAPSGFKESLGARDVADHIATGIRRAIADANIIKAPLVDGGEGFTDALVDATAGRLHRVTVTGPVGDPVKSFFGMLGGTERKTAVIEMAAAAGLSLVPRDRRDPTRTTSYGVGELISKALDCGAERILLGCGDSGINDGGAGMAQALGVGLYDAEGNSIGPGGRELARLQRIDMSSRDPRLERVTIDAAVNWHNVLLGERGVARVFGPQKGATPEQVVELEAALENYAYRIREQTGADIGHCPGSGASGGLGAGLSALLGGTLHPRYDIVMQYLELDRLLARADLVITAEGCLDGQTPYGKIPSEVAQRAKRHGLPVVALAGTIGKGVAINFDHGIDAFSSILKRPCTLEDAIAESDKLLIRAAEDSMRMVQVGMLLSRQQGGQSPKRGRRRSKSARTDDNGDRNDPPRRPRMLAEIPAIMAVS